MVSTYEQKIEKENEQTNINNNLKIGIIKISFNSKEDSKIPSEFDREKKFLNINFPILKENDENNYEDKNINLSKIYNIFEIKNLLKNFPKETLEKIREEFISKKDKESIYLFELKKQRKKREKSNFKFNLKRGRKNNGDDIERKHDKNQSDNIIKKCKGIFFSNLIEYINEYINTYKINDKENFELLKLNYEKYINNLKKENEIKLLNTQLKDVASFEISDKYNKNKDFNKIQVNRILEQEKNNQIINNLLNMTFGEWIDIFTFKNKMDNNIEFFGIHNILRKISETSNNDYFSRFIFYLFNYKRWFINKKGRSRKRKY